VCSFYCQVDIFNLLNSFPSGNWKDDYSKNKKVFTIFLFFVDIIVVSVAPTILQHL